MQRRQHQLPGSRGLAGNLCCFFVSDFPDQNDVRVLPQYTAERCLKGLSESSLDLNLVDGRDAVLDGILDRDDVAIAGIQASQRV